MNPYKCREPDQMMQFYKLALKIAVGARFIIPQLGFNLRKLHELKQYMDREGLRDIPVLANVYVPTATIARMMSAGEIAGCVVSDDLIRRLEHEKKQERLERAALMVAAVRDLGFAGAHIGGFGLTHRDFMSILGRSAGIGSDWKRRIDELIFEVPGEFYLLPPGSDGLSDGSGPYQLEARRPREALIQRLSRTMHNLLIHPDSSCGRFLGKRLRTWADGGQGWRRSFWAGLLAPSTAYRKATLGCVSCGDCIQDHASYAGCTMRWCYKNLRNGPCGGSRTDGSCEADPSIRCIWNLVYLSALGAGEDPARFARTLIPPRDWCLDRTNALVNRFAGLDNYGRRVSVDK